MTGPLLVGIDQGSQSTKVVVHDTAGALVAQGRAPLRPMKMPAPGVVEHPDDDLWDSLVAACRAAVVDLAAAGRDVAEIAGIGLCTIRFCRAMLRADGSLAAPVLSWMDARVSVPYEHTDPAVAFVTASSGYVGHRLTGRTVDTTGQWALDELPARTRLAFEMHRLEERTFPEIARHLDVSVGFAHRLVKQAVAHCASRLAPASKEISLPR